MMPGLVHNLSWDWAEEGIDRAEIAAQADGWHISGTHDSTDYTLQLGPNFIARQITIDTGTEKLALSRSASGWHHANGDLIANSRDAIDPDIGCTALTNTLPIRRLGLDVGAQATLPVLYIPIPMTTPHVVQQRYTRQEEQIYLYENLHSGFQALLTVDNDGWVTDYPGVCKMIHTL